MTASNSLPFVPFWRENEAPYGCFSNYYPAEIVVDGKKFASSETYYQACKFSHCPEYFELIRTAKTIHQSKVLASQQTKSPFANAAWFQSLQPIILDSIKKGICIRKDWESVKLQVMETALKHKFCQHHSLRKVLIDTDGKEIREMSPYDLYWGFGKNGQGKNHLGKLLMKIRTEEIINLKEIHDHFHVHGKSLINH
jgi:N-glycosidase YbiA